VLYSRRSAKKNKQTHQGSDTKEKNKGQLLFDTRLKVILRRCCYYYCYNSHTQALFYWQNEKERSRATKRKEVAPQSHPYTSKRKAQQAEEDTPKEEEEEEEEEERKNGRKE
jgi:hypothetical protein